MRRLPPFLVLTGLFLAACASDGSRPDYAAPADPAAPDTTADPHATYAADRFSFEYDSTAFALYRVRQAIPPDYDAPVDVAKLVPVGRAAQLGREACTYGERGVVETCTAEKEDGLGVAVLPRSMEEVEAQLDSSLAERVERDGWPWTRYSMGAEGYGADYYFHALDDGATLVVFRSYGPDAGPTPAQLETLFDSFEVAR